MKRAFVLLEVMNHMALVATEAKRRGFAVVALNHAPVLRSGPFGVPDGVLDEVVHVDSWSDADHVREVMADVAGRYEIGGTYAAFEPTVPYNAELRRTVGLPHNDPDALRRLLDKSYVRRHLFDEGLSTLRSATLSEAREWTEWPFAGAAVLKPAHGTGSTMCHVVSSLAELRAATEADGELPVGELIRDYIDSRGEFVLEERASGELLSVESFAHHGQLHVLGLQGRYMLADDPVVEQGTMFPYHHPRYDEIVAVAEGFHKALEVLYGPTHVEVMVPADGPIELIDFNPRIAGTGSIVAFNRAYDIHYQRQITDMACGLDPDLSFVDRPVHRYAAEILQLPPRGTAVLHDIEFPPYVECTRVSKELGKPLSGRSDQMDHVGMFVVTGDSAADLHERVLRARRETLVNGEPCGDNPNNHLVHSEYVGRGPDLSR